MTGLKATTNLYWKEIPRDQGTKYVVRVGVAFFGHSLQGDKNPFDEDWYDNYVEGKGYTKEAALRSLKRNFRELGDSLWL